MWVERSRMLDGQDGYDGDDGPVGVDGFDGYDGYDGGDGFGGVDGCDGLQIKRIGVDDVLGYDHHGKMVVPIDDFCTKREFWL